MVVGLRFHSREEVAMKFLLSKSLKKIQAFLLVTAMVISSFSSAITAKADEPKGQKQSESSYLNPNGGGG